jgi:hypothetical protein
MFNFLTNPLETFKSFSYNFDITLLLSIPEIDNPNSMDIINNPIFDNKFFIGGNP